MQWQDDRTEEQRRTHSILIGGTDKFMSGWGKAAGGRSVALWACTIEDADEVLAWVQGRGDIRGAQMVSRTYHPNGRGHVHIYVVGTEHPARANARAREVRQAQLA